MSNTNTQVDLEAQAPAAKRPGKWYTLAVLPQHEDKVIRELTQAAENLGMQNQIFEVVAPVEEVTTFKRGERVIESRLLFPGYVLVRCHMNDAVWDVLRNSSKGVSAVIGSGVTPVPMSPDEVERFLGEERTAAPGHTGFEEGDVVDIVDGPFSSFSGVIASVDHETASADVVLSIFGRETETAISTDHLRK